MINEEKKEIKSAITELAGLEKLMDFLPGATGGDRHQKECIKKRLEWTIKDLKGLL